MLLSWFYNTIRSDPSPAWLDSLGNVAVATFVLIPGAIAIAVLKHALYGIDRLISRTLSYAVITGTLLAVYVGLVTTVSRFTPKDNSAAVAASTLAVAALFSPLRHRVQAAVDRRFNRAATTRTARSRAFSARLRDEVDLAALEADLLAVVRGTMQPASAGLWLRDATR